MRLLRLAFALAGCFLFLGCGDDAGTGSVSGTITLDGSPLTAGIVTFHSSGKSQPAVASTGIAGGQYAIPKIASGSAKISVQSLKPSQPGANPDGTVPPAPKGPYMPIPEKYKNPEQSGLMFDVKTGPQKHDFDVKTK
ncbi:MAG: hypothetical protein K2X38_12895 [Gemmataceae bacterium]|nr:hypothetical protein [Gemmataceae bacterium]